jgi:hypothetical protein
MSHTIRHTRPVGLLCTRDQIFAEAATYTTHHQQHKRRTSMPSAGTRTHDPRKKSGRRLHFRLHRHRASEIGYSHLETTLECQAKCAVSQQDEATNFCNTLSIWLEPHAVKHRFQWQISNRLWQHDNSKPTRIQSRQKSLTFVISGTLFVTHNTGPYFNCVTQYIVSPTVLNLPSHRS